MNAIDYWYKKYMALKETERIPKPELNWEDVQIIWMEAERYMKELRQIERTDLSKFPSSSREIFEEILRRYKEAKK